MFSVIADCVNLHITNLLLWTASYYKKNPDLDPDKLCWSFTYSTLNLPQMSTLKDVEEFSELCAYNWYLKEVYASCSWQCRQIVQVDT